MSRLLYVITIYDISWQSYQPVPVQQLLAQVPMTSVPTKIYRSKVTTIISWPRPSSWMWWWLPNTFFVKFNVHRVVYSEPRYFIKYKWLLKICWLWGQPQMALCHFLLARTLQVTSGEDTIKGKLFTAANFNCQHNSHHQCHGSACIATWHAACGVWTLQSSRVSHLIS